MHFIHMESRNSLSPGRNVFQSTIPIIWKQGWLSSDHFVLTARFPSASLLMETQLLCLRLLIHGLTPFFHGWVWALIITDKHQSPLPASSPSFNITLIFHLWLLIQSFIINKRSVNVAIIARLLRQITSGTPVLLSLPLEGDGLRETVGRQYCKRASQIFLCQQHQSQVRHARRQLLYMPSKKKGVAEAPAHPAQSGSSSSQGMKRQRDSSAVTTERRWSSWRACVWVTTPFWTLLGLKRSLWTSGHMLTTLHGAKSVGVQISEDLIWSINTTHLPGCTPSGGRSVRDYYTPVRRNAVHFTYTAGMKVEL